MPRIKKILAPTHFSDVSKFGVRYALEMARDASAEVVVYHAIDVGGEWKDNARTPFLEPIRTFAQTWWGTRGS